MAKKKVSIKEVTNKYSLFLLVLLLFSMISLLWIKDFSGWLIYSAVLFTGMINSFVLWLLISNKKVMNNLAKIIILALLMHNIVGWFEVATGIYPFAFNITSNKGNANYKITLQDIKDEELENAYNNRRIDHKYLRYYLKNL